MSSPDPVPGEGGGGSEGVGDLERAEWSAGAAVGVRRIPGRWDLTAAWWCWRARPGRWRVLADAGSGPVDPAVFVDLLVLAVAGRCVPGRRDPATPETFWF